MFLTLQRIGGTMVRLAASPREIEAVRGTRDWTQFEAGVDLARARAAIETGAFDDQLRSNGQLAAELGVSGTPAWVIGDQALNGAVGREALEEAIEEARQS